MADRKGKGECEVRYRKKPVVIEARQLGETNVDELALWCNGVVFGDPSGVAIAIRTLEGVMEAHKGDWIIKGVKDEFYPCKPDIFEATYEPSE